MRLLWPLIIAAILGLIAGALSAGWMAGLLLSGPRLGDGVKVNGWTSDWSIGADSANPYIRARIARRGLLALRKEEAVYFTAARDSDGNPLSDKCIYRVSGGEMPAEWWSITLYDGDSRLPMNEDGALSFDATKAADTGTPENWSFRVSQQQNGRPGEVWVSSRNAGQFDLTLRLYLPDDAFLTRPENALKPPVIDQLFCEEGAA
jgi:hypothetical protein